jgi:hypothetical protein
MRVSVGSQTLTRCCNTANSSLTIDGKFERGDFAGEILDF